MSADRQEERIREPIRDMEKSSDQMESRLEELEEDIAGAKKTAAQRQDAPDTSDTGDPIVEVESDRDEDEDDADDEEKDEES